FQIQHAIGAEQRLRPKTEQPQPAPAWLQARLARAYEKDKQPDPAAKLYIGAAKGFLQARDTQRALEAIGSFKRLAENRPPDWTVPHQDVERLDRIATNMKKVRVRETLRQGWPVVAVTFLPDNERLLWGVGNEMICWAPEKKATRFATIDKSLVQALAVTPDGKMFANVAGGSIEVCTLEGQGNRLEGGTGPYVTAAISPDGSILAAGSKAGNLTLWRLSDKKLLRSIIVPRDNIAPPAFSPSGNNIAIAAANNVIVVDTATGKQRAT